MPVSDRWLLVIGRVHFGSSSILLNTFLGTPCSTHQRLGEDSSSVLLTCPGARGWRQHPPRRAVNQSDPCGEKLWRQNCMFSEIIPWCLLIYFTYEARFISAHKSKPGGCNCHCRVSIAGQMFKIRPLLEKLNNDKAKRFAKIMGRSVLQVAFVLLHFCQNISER